MTGVVTATLASWVVGLVAEETAEQEAATRAQVAELGLQDKLCCGRLVPGVVVGGWSGVVRSMRWRL